MVSERGLAVLRVIVQDYVASREPVGSKSIVERHSFGVSAATIRNDMALLEEEELITAPHTSSGRIPTDKGYRLFVNQLAELQPLSRAQRQAIEAFLSESGDIDDVLARTVRLLSQLTNQVALVQYPSLGQSRIRHIELISIHEARLLAVLITDSGRVDQTVIDLPADVDEQFLADLRVRVNKHLDGVALSDAPPLFRDLPELFEPAQQGIVRAVAAGLTEQVAQSRHDKLVLAGTANLARTEEDFRGSITPVLEAIEEQVTLLRLFSEMEHEMGAIAVRIGRENESYGLGEASVLISGYQGGGGEVARLGVLGPTRMDYSGNMVAVRAVARYLSNLLSDG